MKEERRKLKTVYSLTGDIHDILDRLRIQRRCGTLTIHLNHGGTNFIEFEETQYPAPQDGVSKKVVDTTQSVSV